MGAGIFGVTIAWKLAAAGFNVDLYEKKKDILLGTSAVNQLRLHRGYHYPRSRETALECLRGEPEFRKEYREAIIDKLPHYYCIASHKSLTSAKQFAEFSASLNLDCREVSLDFARKTSIEASFKVKESTINLKELRRVCSKKLHDCGIKTIYRAARLSTLADYDIAVVASYSALNEFFDEGSEESRPYQFEVCEVGVLKMPGPLTNLSVVVLDGPFVCFDPYGNSGTSLLYDVIQSVHHTNVGIHPTVPAKFRKSLNAGIVSPSYARCRRMIGSASRFFPSLSDAERIGSMFTVRAVPAYREHDDARPTVVRGISKRMITVFSGKLCTAVTAANRVVEIAKTGKR